MYLITVYQHYQQYSAPKQNQLRFGSEPFQEMRGVFSPSVSPFLFCPPPSGRSGGARSGTVPDAFCFRIQHYAGTVSYRAEGCAGERGPLHACGDGVVQVSVARAPSPRVTADCQWFCRALPRPKDLLRWLEKNNDRVQPEFEVRGCSLFRMSVGLKSKMGVHILSHSIPGRRQSVPGFLSVLGL